LALPISKTLVVPEEKRLIFADRSADAGAELVLLQRFDLTVESEEVGGVERVVAQELPKRAVKLVRAGAGNNVRGGTSGMSEFGVGAVSQDSEFGDCIHRWLEHEAAIDSIEVAGAVDEEVVRLRALTVHRVSLALA